MEIQMNVCETSTSFQNFFFYKNELDGFNEFFLSEFQAYVNSKKIRNHSKRFQLATSHTSDRKSFLRVHTFYDCGRKKKKIQNVSQLFTYSMKTISLLPTLF